MAEQKLYKEFIEELLRRIGNTLDTEITVYLIGGGAMLLTGTKLTTKDIDIVIENKDIMDTLSKSLSKIGFGRVEAPETSGKDEASAVCFKNKDGTRFDIYINKIANKLVLSEDMINRAERFLEFEQIKLNKLSNEDLFLIKSVTGRKADLEDLKTLFETGLNWEIILAECKHQNYLTNRIWYIILLDSVNDLEHEYNLICPVKDKIEALTEQEL